MDSQQEVREVEEPPHTPVVSFLGPISSYTHQAALSCFESDKYNYKAAQTITDVFTAVQSGEAELGVVPFENSTNGAVIFTLELLADRHKLFPDITVCAEAYLDVSHYLLGRMPRRTPTIDSPDMSGSCTPTTSIPSPLQPRAKPLCSLKHIERIYTHPQAWGQCEIFLGAYLKGIERIDVSSTSRAAEIVKEDTSGTSAAIASSLAAEIHNLDILAKGIEDREDNTTRFFVLRKGIDKSLKTSKGKTKSLISFTIDHRSPGALAQVLDCFRGYALNLTSINSRPSKVIPFQYIFFVEFEGSKLNDPSRRSRHAHAAHRHKPPSLNNSRRRANYIYDYLSPTQSHLLNITLADFLPESCYPSNFHKSNLTLPLARPRGPTLQEIQGGLGSTRPSKALDLPQGHHLVYFPPQVLSSDLLPDGTDPVQSPGPPYVRRMWAGGSLVFDPAPARPLVLDASRVVCREKITDVSVKGADSQEKVFVTIERRVGLSSEQEQDSEVPANTVALERRNLVFMEEKTVAAAKEDAARPDKILKPALTPDASVSITPTQSLLFRFSALSFNAHGIHLDPQYCREVEGHRNLLVHGPLSLVLMLSVLRSQLQEEEMIFKFDYRNLAPLYASEKMNVCVRRDPKQSSKFDVWIEGSHGGYAVKGSALIGRSGVKTPFDGSEALEK
ncbi:hypothetical protein G7Y89_g14495 [Cudoniella acicularis]|uniref:prephenate dehydratase n=1 Tax=Cudoniella acicularis TaxID=354080 RepID=A0A8H4R1L5_9HELO|nr:hypothetical protein G7Y89_g14495 [Cudoniella acicularis]